MPPRVASQHVASSIITPTFRTRPQCLCEVLLSRQQFHISSRALAENDDASSSKASRSGGRTRGTRLRRDMFEWLNGKGRAFKQPLPNSTNYMNAYDRNGRLNRSKRDRDERPIDVIPVEQEDEIQAKEEEDGLDEAERKSRFEKREQLRAQKQEQESKQAALPKERTRDLEPFPLNRDFRSEAVLSEALREEIYRQVVVRDMDIKTISAAFGVDTRRVAAVVRLKTIEKQWTEQGTPLAKPYAKAVLAMLPQTPFDGARIIPHESINDLPVHPHTRKQLFLSTSESRVFTREDAAKAFNPRLLPADARIPHPELITLEKEHLAGIERAERLERQAARDAAAKAAKAKADAKRAIWESQNVRVVPSRRWDFQFQNVSVDKVGRNGRGREAVGVRYGQPHMDRKKGQVKIPTSVE